MRWRSGWRRWRAAWRRLLRRMRRTRGSGTVRRPTEGDEAQSQERAAQGDGAVPPAAEAGASGGHRRRGRGFALRRLDPEVVTEVAADDPEVYGDAWPLVEEWRSLAV